MERRTTVILDYHGNGGKDQVVAFYANHANCDEIKYGFITATPRGLKAPRDLDIEFNYVIGGKYRITGEFNYLKVDPNYYPFDDPRLRTGYSALGPVLIDTEHNTFYLYNYKKQYVSIHAGPEEFLLHGDRDPRYDKRILSTVRGKALTEEYISVDKDVPKVYANYLVFIRHRVNSYRVEIGLFKAFKKYFLYFHNAGVTEVDIRDIISFKEKCNIRSVKEIDPAVLLIYLLCNGRINKDEIPDNIGYSVEDRIGYLFLPTSSLILYCDTCNITEIRHRKYAWRTAALKEEIKNELKLRKGEYNG